MPSIIWIVRGVAVLYQYCILMQCVCGMGIRVCVNRTQARRMRSAHTQKRRIDTMPDLECKKAQNSLTAEVNNRYALVTGASRGIGRAIATALAKEGYHLFLTCLRSEKELTELSDALSASYSIQCTSVIADVGNPEDVARLFQQIPKLNLLINNAGISYIGLLQDMSTADWQKLMHTNLDALFYTSRLAIPLMLRQGSGSIINISSVWGNCGASMEVAYSASKGGVNSFTKALAKELAPSSIQVNAIACGVIDTEMNHCFTEDEMNALREEIPSDRIGQPEEVAQMVLSILHAPAYMTGQIITLDGGWT